jgi:hypothetical protein
MSRIVDIRLVRTRDDDVRASSPDGPVAVWSIGACSSCPFEYDTISCNLSEERLSLVDVEDGKVHADCPLRKWPFVAVLAEGA